MNTKTDGISSGLVAVAWQHSQRGLGDSEWQEWKTISWKPQGPESERFRMRPLCVISDAEAIIAQKDAEILEQCRINGMGAEREATLLGKVERQSAALKLARQVLMSVKETSSSTRLRRIVDEPLAAINEVLGEVK